MALPEDDKSNAIERGNQLLRDAMRLLDADGDQPPLDAGDASVLRHRRADGITQQPDESDRDQG